MTDKIYNKISAIRHSVLKALYCEDTKETLLEVITIIEDLVILLDKEESKQGG